MDRIASKIESILFVAGEPVLLSELCRGLELTDGELKQKLFELQLSYEAEDRAVALFYSSVYGDTASVVDALAGKLAEKGIRDIRIYDVSNTDISDMIAEMFRVSTIVLAATTYNAGIFPKMENLIADMKALQVQKRKVALIENGSWAPMSGKKMKEELEGMKEMQILEPAVTVRSAMKASQEAELDALAGAIAGSI